MEPKIKWDCPSGTYLATMHDHIEVRTNGTNGETETKLRLRFKIQSLSRDMEIVLVARNFSPNLNPNDDLRRMLEHWVGDKFIEANLQNGEFDFDSLTGVKALVEVVGILNKNYPKPYIY